MNDPIRKQNPRENSNILSIITFAFNIPLLVKGCKRGFLQDSDIYRVLTTFEANKLGDVLEREWNEKRKFNKKSKLWKILFRNYGLTYLIFFVVGLAVGTFLLIVEPIVLSELINQFKIGVKKNNKIYYYGFCVVILKIFRILYESNMTQFLMEYSLKIRTAVTSLIFRKALRISPKALEEITVGKAITLISKDIFSIGEALRHIYLMIIGLIHIIVATDILLGKCGQIGFYPVVVLLVMIPIQIFSGVKTSTTRLQMAALTDKRFRLIQEALSSIKVIKMYVWETYFEKLIFRIRLTEVQKLRIIFYLKAFIGWLGALANTLAVYVFLLFYMTEPEVKTEIVYFVISILGNLQSAVMVHIPMAICNTADLAAAFKRMQKFLDAGELSDTHSEQDEGQRPKVLLREVQIANKKVIKSISLDVEEGLLVVSGNTGVGKTTLLQAILGECSVYKGGIFVKGSISYAPAEPWIFPGSIKENILFGEPFCSLRYNVVLKVCALLHDMNQFEKRDESLIGDKGVNLSKGQQARLSLARTIYKKSDIYIIDDCLSCLDNNVSNYIFTNCINKFLKEKLCILVSNNINFIKQATHHLDLENCINIKVDPISNGFDKRVTYYIDDDVTKIKNDTNTNSYIEEVISIETDTVNDIDLELQKSTNQNQTVLYKEETKHGGVSWKNYLIYYKLMGGTFVMFYLVVAFALAQGSLVYAARILVKWIQFETKPDARKNSDQSTAKYITLYTTLIVIGMAIAIMRSYSTFHCCLMVAKNLHNLVVKAMLNTNLSFFDNHLIGNIINRLSKDLYVTDEYMPFLVFDYIRLIISFVITIVMIGLISMWFYIPGLILLGILFIIQVFYLPSSTSLRRLEAAVRSPVVGYLNCIFDGLPIVRASKHQEVVKLKFDQYHDVYASAYFMVQSATQFYGLALGVISILFVISIQIIIMSVGGFDGAEVGFVLTQCLGLSSIIKYAIQQSTELENSMTSVERIVEYGSAKQENKNGAIPNDFSLKGDIRFINVSLSYQSNAIPVLQNLKFCIRNGTKIGVVGRTGAGKSSIVSLLFRLYAFEGKIFIGNTDINTLPLSYLRTNISMIPQDPILFTGTIRSNLDPFNKYSDAEIWKVLESIYISHLVTDLNQKIVNENSDFSSGQKQLLCLGRALLLDNSIIVLDEATANLDPATDIMLQNTIRNHFNHRTVIIIAHKIESVTWCDKVLEIENGRIINFDDPRNLLENDSSLLYQMKE